MGSITAMFVVIGLALATGIAILAVDSLLTKRAMEKNDEWRNLTDTVKWGRFDFNNKEQ